MSEDLLLQLIGEHGHWITHLSDALFGLVIMLAVIVLLKRISGGFGKDEFDFVIDHPKITTIVCIIIILILTICGHLFKINSQ